MNKLMILLFTLFTFQVNSQTIAGAWNGKLSFQGMELRLVLHVTEDNGNYRSTMDSPDQGAAGIEMDKTTYENGLLTVESNALGMQYKAKLNETGDKIEGTFIQQGVSIPLTMTLETEKKNSAYPKGIGAAKEVLGDWNGVLDISGIQLMIVIHVMNVDGTLQSTMDSPDQGAMGIQMNETVYEDNKLTITANSLNAEYTAELNQSGDTLIGTFSQNGMELDLRMTKETVERAPVIRPQEPKEFPYRQEEVKFENPKGGHHLAGTLTIPIDGKYDKVAVLISGSGPQDRNEEIMNHKPFLVLSDHLTRQGIAVLRYDDRGVAESEGSFSTATSKDFADDAAAAVAYLKNRKEMKGKTIGLVGHSEGGMIAPIVASENSDIDFIVLLAGPGIDIQELLILQQDKIAEANGVSEASRKALTDYSNETFDYLNKNTTMSQEELITGLTILLEDGYDKLSQEQQQTIGKKDNFINQQIRILTSDWFSYFVRYNPRDFLSMVTCPVLAVNGELDLQVTSKENLEGIRKILEQVNNKNVTIHEFKGLNHLFQKTETGAPSEYGTLEETFNEEAMEYIAKWIIELKI